MPSSPITKKVQPLPDNWVHLQKTMIPDSNTCCYFSVWYDCCDLTDPKEEWLNCKIHKKKNTAWLMWCPFGDDPSVNDTWGHVEELSGDTKNVLTAIESVYKVSFHECVWVELPAKEFPLSE